MKILLALAILSSAVYADFGANLPIKAENLKFTLQPVQGAVDTVCTHTLTNAASQDWEVLCKDNAGAVKNRYAVHLWVSRYGHASGPKVSFEVLYWVDDRTKADIKSVGTTVWFHLNEDTSIHSLQLNQFVDNGLAALEIEIKAPHAN